MKDTLVHFLADIPAYAVIAWVNLVQVVPGDLSGIEEFLLHWGWLLLLVVRLLNAFIELYKRSRQHDFTIIEDGEQKKVSILKSIFWELKNIMK